MTKLNQVIAVEKGIKNRVYADLSHLHHACAKSALFNGFAKQYQPLAEDGEKLPSENQKVQLTAQQAIEQTQHLLKDLFDVTAVKDWTNCAAVADVKLGEKVLLPKVPVSYLLFLEKQLTDIRTFVAGLPVLDDSENWTKDDNSGLYRTGETKTHRTKKVQKALVLYPATPEHPAQTQMITEDVIAGHWSLTKHSGAIARPQKEAVALRVEEVLRAVKEAREEANGINVVETPDVSKAVFGYIFS